MVNTKHNKSITATSCNICNLDYLVNVTRGDKVRINNLVSLFFTETHQELLLLSEAVDVKNYAVISSISHKLKSAFLILGISLLDPVFTEMELLSSNSSAVSNIRILNQRVNLIFKLAKAEMMIENNTEKVL
jgi:hypothetical protein